ncbi:AAA+ ATPase domain-containing protein [Tanacetum coccineum]
MSSRMFTEMPTTSSMLSAYASLSTSMMLFRTMYDQLVPTQVRSYIIDVLKCYWKPKTSDQLTLLFEERDGHGLNDMFYAVEVFLSTKITTDSKRLNLLWGVTSLLLQNLQLNHFNCDLCIPVLDRITKSMNDEHIMIKFADSETIVDSFEGVTVTWKYHSQQQNQRSANNDGDQEKTYMELIFDKNSKDIIISSYLPFIIKKLKNSKTRVKQYSFIAYNTEYTGKGKSSLIAAMANYLKFDIYELQLMHVHGDASLRELLLQTSNRSILVIEDIDCSTLPDRNGTASSNGSHLDSSKVFLLFSSQMSLGDSLVNRLEVCLSQYHLLIRLADLPGKRLASIDVMKELNRKHKRTTIFLI